MKGICPKCHEVVELEEMNICVEEGDYADEFESTFNERKGK